MIGMAQNKVRVLPVSGLRFKLQYGRWECVIVGRSELSRAAAEKLALWLFQPHNLERFQERSTAHPGFRKSVRRSFRKSNCHFLARRIHNEHAVVDVWNRQHPRGHRRVEKVATLSNHLPDQT